jgi:phosphatidylglycerophosphate synthase
MPRTYTAADFLAQHRGGGLFTERVSQRVGARLAFAGYRLGLSPAALTLAGLVIGVGGSAALVVTPRGGWALGLVVTLAWQLAYALDCADGQLARVTRTASPAGARLDILCDVAVQVSVVTALAAVAADAPTWLVALFAGSWMVNVVTSVLATGPAAASLVSTRSVAVRLAKLVRDYGFVALLCGLVVTVWPGGVWWLFVAFSFVNGGFLLASVAQVAPTLARRHGTLSVRSGTANERGVSE